MLCALAHVHTFHRMSGIVWRCNHRDIFAIRRARSVLVFTLHFFKGYIAQGSASGQYAAIFQPQPVDVPLIQTIIPNVYKSGVCQDVPEN